MTSTNSLSLQQIPAYILLRKSFQQTKTHLSITNLNFSHPLIQKGPEIFLIFLQRNHKKLRSIPPKLKRLTLDIHLVQHSPLPLYNHLLKDLKHIEHLKITLCPNSGHQVPSYFQILLKTLKKLRNLQVLEVIASRHFQWTEENSVSSLIKTLSKSAPKLKDVKLIFESFVSEPRYKTLLFEWRIQKLKILQNLTLHLPRAAFVTVNTEDEGKFDLSPLRSFRRLKSLDLAILESSRDTRPYFKKVIFEPSKIRLFPNLKQFQWNLIDSHCTDIEGLQLLGAELAASFRVPPEDFTLKFKQSRLLNDSERMIVNQYFASLTTDLSQLHLLWKEADNKGSESLISLLLAPKIRRMRIIDLMILDCKGINDRYMTRFGQVISPELRYLRLRFEFIKESKKGFVKALKKFFGGGEEEGITDKGISEFGVNLAEKCKNLQFVWLEFGKYVKISDIGVKSLCESLSKIESLKRVWLKFRLCGEVTGEYAKEILGSNREVQFALI